MNCPICGFYLLGVLLSASRIFARNDSSRAGCAIVWASDWDEPVHRTGWFRPARRMVRFIRGDEWVHRRAGVFHRQGWFISSAGMNPTGGALVPTSGRLVQFIVGDGFARRRDESGFRSWGARPSRVQPRAWVTENSVQEQSNASVVFREYAENGARDGRAPHFNCGVRDEGSLPADGPAPSPRRPTGGGRLMINVA